LPRKEIDSLITINDGTPYKSPPKAGAYIQHEQNKGVGISKNEAMQYLLDEGCEHIFLIEDDIIIKDSTVFKKYIDTAAASGLWHLMYGYHGPANKTPDKRVNPRAIIDYKDHKVALNQHCVGAFCYYHKGVLKNIGLMDEVFKNAWEHVEHSYQIVKAGLLPGYWWWPDVANSYDYLDELACSEESSSIRWEDEKTKVPKQDWQENIQKGAEHFISKHGTSPVAVPDQSIDMIKSNLNLIKERYSKQLCTTSAT
jgi:glycosyltransferase involved in cell wall biosynthesis